MNLKRMLLPIFFTGLTSCHQVQPSEDKSTKHSFPFIQAPLAGVDVPYQNFEVNADRGISILYKNGTLIYFPPNAFVDNNGMLIKGKVDIKYREFNTPQDFYLSGIPMNYDSVGVRYNFESSGMCEILAFQSGKAVFVNPKSKPKINLVNTNTVPARSLYFLDTTQKKWINKGAASLNSPILTEKSTSQNGNVSALLKPEKPNPQKGPVITITVDPASFSELMVYDHLKFQLEDKNASLDPKDLNDEWSRVDLLKSKTKGIYTVKFSNDKRVIVYQARPVLEGKDYDKALEKFEANNIRFQNKLDKRLATDSLNKIQNEYILANKNRIDSINKIINAQNKVTAYNNKLIEDRNKALEDRKKIIEQQNEEAKRRYEDGNKTNEIIQSFNIDGFGIWNCDNPKIINDRQVLAIFKDKKGNLINLSCVAVVYHSINGIALFHTNNIKIQVDADNMIWGVENGRLAYLSYRDYHSLNINASSKEQVFVMNFVSEKENNYDFISKLAL